MGSTWKVIPKFFRVDTAGTKDSLRGLDPDGPGGPLVAGDARVRIEFQGADESGAGSNEPGTTTDWTADLADLKGLRFLRYRVTFHIDEDGTGITLSSPRPSLDYIKIPLVW